jgi:hypothetical protein
MFFTTQVPQPSFSAKFFLHIERKKERKTDRKKEKNLTDDNYSSHRDLQETSLKMVNTFGR